MENLTPTQEFSGKITLELQPGKSLDAICEKFITNYEVSRFEAVAVRVFAGKEFIVTIYAQDKLSQKDLNGSLPVKKFKLENLNPYQLQEFLASFNFTVSNPKYNFDEMEVINK